MQRGKPLKSMNTYLAVVAAVGLVGLLISLFLMADFFGPVKKIVGHTMENFFGSR